MSSSFGWNNVSSASDLAPFGGGTSVRSGCSKFLARIAERLRTGHEVDEQLRRVRAVRSLEDRHRRVIHQRERLRVVDRQRIALRGAAQRRGGAADRHLTLAGVQHGHGVVDRASDQRVQFVQLLEKPPAVFLGHPDGPDRHQTAVVRTAEGDLALPLLVCQVGPVLRRFRRGDLLRVVHDRHQADPTGAVVPAAVERAERRHQSRRIRRRVLHQLALFDQIGHVAGVGAAEHVGLHGAAVDVLHHPLEGDLGGGLGGIDPDARIFLRECVADRIADRLIEIARVPGDPAFLLRRRIERLLILRPRRRHRESARTQRHHRKCRRPPRECHCTFPPWTSFNLQEIPAKSLRPRFPRCASPGEWRGCLGAGH